VKISEEEPFDELNDPKENGVHDLKMGGWMDFEHHCCPCCKLTFKSGCKGHYGRVELCTEVYNPFMMVQLFKLLKQSCSKCSHFRMGCADKKKFLA
jgi:DNA-directed RNA polymerase beta' subunit